MCQQGYLIFEICNHGHLDQSNILHASLSDIVRCFHKNAVLIATYTVHHVQDDADD